MTQKFSERDITRAIAESFLKQFSEYAYSDCIIIGAGPSGLTAGKAIAKKGKKVLIVERNNYLGGGFWIGGFLMNKITIKEPGEKILEELSVPYEKYKEGLYVADAPYACSSLIRAAAEAGVKFLNMTSFDDLVIKNNRVSGVVVNWTPVGALPRQITCVDPVALEAKIILDATGHEACVCSRLQDRGLLSLKGMGAMWVEESEKMVVEYTSEVYPGLVVAGMATSTVFGLPRMGPIFSSMLLSGKKAAEVIISNLEKIK